MTHEPNAAMDQFSAHLDRGWDLVARGDFAGALVSAQKSLELHSDAPEAHHLMGYVRQCEGAAEEALDHYRQAIDLDDTFFEAMVFAAELLVHHLDEPEQALRLLDDADDFSETDDEIAEAMLLRAEALRALGRDDEAARTVAALPEGPFEVPWIEFALGEVLLDLGQFDRAEVHLTRAVERDPTNPDTHYTLALVHEGRGDLRSATLSFLQARGLDAAAPPPPNALPSDQFEGRVQAAIDRLAPPVRQVLEGALVVVGDLPGIEMVADGVDPRAEALVDDVAGEGAAARVGRLFVYQRNVERHALGFLEIEELLRQAVEREVGSAVPHVAAALEAVAARDTAGDA